MSSKSKATGGRGVSWRHRETADLIAIWGDAAVQSELRSNHRNIEVFEEIAKAMAERGHNRTAHECRTKTKTLRMEYKRVVAHNKISGNRWKTCNFHQELESILSYDASMKPMHISRSTDYVVETADQTEEVTPGSQELISQDITMVNLQDILPSTSDDTDEWQDLEETQDSFVPPDVNPGSSQGSSGGSWNPNFSSLEPRYSASETTPRRDPIPGASLQVSSQLASAGNGDHINSQIKQCQLRDAIPGASLQGSSQLASARNGDHTSSLVEHSQLRDASPGASLQVSTQHFTAGNGNHNNSTVERISLRDSDSDPVDGRRPWTPLQTPRVSGRGGRATRGHASSFPSRTLGQMSPSSRLQHQRRKRVALVADMARELLTQAERQDQRLESMLREEQRREEARDQRRAELEQRRMEAEDRRFAQLLETVGQLRQDLVLGIQSAITACSRPLSDQTRVAPTLPLVPALTEALPSVPQDASRGKEA